MRDLMTRTAIEAMTRITTDVKNPLDGVKPDLSVFGVTFSSRVSIILGGLWALALILAAAAVIMGAAKWAWATRVSHSSDGALESAGQFKTALIAFGALAGASLLIGAIIFLVQG